MHLHLLSLLIQYIEAIENISHQCILFIDCKNKKILNKSRKLHHILRAIHPEMLKHVDDVEAFENYITAEEIKRIYNIMKEGVSFINTLNLSITEFKLILNAKLTKRYLNTTLNLKVNFINTMHNHIIPEYAICAISIGSDDIFTPILLKHNLQKCFTLENGLWNIQELPKLSDVEKKIIILSSRGYTISELSTILMKSTDTIKSYRRSLFEKLNAKNIVQAISIAQNYQLI